VWDKISSTAYDIGYASVTIYRDQSNLIPLSDNISTVMVVGPKDYWGMYEKVYDSLRSKNITADIIQYSLPLSSPVPETYYLNSIPSKVNQYDLVIILTWDAHLSRVRFGDTFQSDLVDALSKKSVPIMIVGLKSPTDILEFPDIPTYLATFGTTTGQIQGFVDTIIGSYDPNGQNPLPGLP
jgi:beta-N-acetylhexosaminidase